MKNLFLKSIMLLFVVFLYCACSNEVEDTIETGTQSKDVELVNDGTMLKFKDQATFEKMISESSNFVSLKEENQNVADLRSSTGKSFQSLEALYEQAMAEAEDYCETEEGYKAFKAKYPFLYFPEEGDDFSAYLPVSNENIANYVNADGDVIIGNEVKNFKDVDSYQKLVELGKTPPETNALKAFPEGYTNDVNDDNRHEFKSENDRRLWVKSRRYIHKGEYAFHFEVSFRKKGLFGKWYNYSSATILWGNTISKGLFFEFDGRTPMYQHWSKDESSSHDYYIYVKKEYYQAGMSGTINIDFRGFKTNPVTYYFEIPYISRI